MLDLVHPIVGTDARAVRRIFFDKTAGANWPVPWHQDLSLAVVADKREIEGWTAWSVKNGIPHVQPPADLLARMLTVRLQLDDCGPESGPLKVRPGTHRMGRLTREAIEATRSTSEEETCCVKRGDAILMRPPSAPCLIRSDEPHPSAVIHLEYAPSGLLPDGLDWAL